MCVGGESKPSDPFLNAYRSWTHMRRRTTQEEEPKRALSPSRQRLKLLIFVYFAFIFRANCGSDMI